VPPHVFALDAERLSYAFFPRNNGEGPRFGEYHSVDVPADFFNDGPLGGSLREPANLRQLLGELLEKMSMTVDEASLVLPDEWLRLSFAESEELPRAPAEREEVLRWKLKLQVPFRVDDLRLSATEVPPLESQEEPMRLLMEFGIEQLLAQVEDSFDQAGVRLGHVGNRSLSLLTALGSALSGLDAAAVALVDENAYSLLIVSRGEPIVHRYKSYNTELPFEAMRRFVLRDLRLTRTFLEEKNEDEAIQRTVLVAPEESQVIWSGWLEEVFEAPVHLLIQEWPFLENAAPGVGGYQMAPLFGAACREVA
jgi:hypothetical protein